MLAGAVARLSREAAEAVSVQLERQHSVHDEDGGLLPAVDLGMWAAGLHWSASGGGLEEMYTLECATQRAVETARAAVEEALDAEAAELDARLPAHATYAPTEWAVHGERVTLSDFGRLATKAVQWTELGDLLLEAGDQHRQYEQIIPFSPSPSLNRFGSVPTHGGI